MNDLSHTPLEKLVDWSELMERVDGDRELLKELFELFRGEFPRMRDQLHAAVKQGDLAEIQRAAHTLKGMMVNLSLKQGATLAANIEAAARSGDRLEIIAAKEEFDREAARLVPALEIYVEGLK